MRRVVAGLGLLLAALAPPAQAGPLKLATWNLEWLTLRPAGDPALPADVTPRVPADFDRLRAYAGILNADVVALEEVDGPEAAARVFPPGQYTLHFTGDAVVQRVGLAVRNGIGFTVNPDDTALNVYGAGAHFPLRSGADITLDLAHGQHLRILAVHLKSGCWDKRLDAAAKPCAALREQVPVVAAWIAARRAEGVAFAVLGDFNRVMDGDDAMLAALRAAAPLARGTEGFADPCWGGDRFIDHILLGGPAIAWLAPDSLRVLVYRETDDAARAHISDHCPVSVRLNVPD
jgi:endonuclease/exonuclease/phosphatase family metal-dependent hydrolase